MSKPSVAGGLCLTCKFDPDCIYEARSDRAILQCEQFEMGFRQSPAPAPPVSKCCASRERIERVSRPLLKLRKPGNLHLSQTRGRSLALRRVRINI